MSFNKLLPGRKHSTFNPIGELSEKVSQVTASRSMNDNAVGTMAISSESMDSQGQQQLSSFYGNMESSIRAIAEDFDIAVEAHQIEAATMAGVFGTNPQGFMTTKLRNPQQGAVMVQSSVIDGHPERPVLSTEAYDERANRNAQMQSIVYNLLASRQDEFGETFFPTININPTEVGITLSVNLFYVYNDFKRNVTGSLANYARKNIIRAYADSEILKNELTRVVPVRRAGGGADDNQAVFAADAGTWSVDLGNNVVVPTGALKVDTKVDLLGISQTNELLNSGIMGPSDNLDAHIKLESIFVKLTKGGDSEVVQIFTDNLPASTFTYAPQGNTRRMLLSMDTDSVVLDKNLKTVAGIAPTVLPELASNSVRVQLTVSGSVVLDKGDSILNRGSLTLTTMRNAGGALVTGSGFDDVAAVIDSAEIIGYTLTAFRANSNIRQRGQLLDGQSEYRVITVPYRSPIAAIMPVNGGANDTSPLQNLVTTTAIRTSNDAVHALLKAAAVLKGYAPIANADGSLPEMEFIGHHYVKPVFFEETLDLSRVVDSLSSHERAKDIRAALVEKVRFYANGMYRESEYKAAATVLTGSKDFKPTVIIGTDPVLANYIQHDGDLRTLGENFDVKVVSTIDSRMKGKLMISFGVFDASRNTVVNPLNFGNMFYSPELTLQLPAVSRDGAVSEELIVSPRYLHSASLPIMTVLTVENLADVTSKVTRFTKEQ